MQSELKALKAKNIRLATENQEYGKNARMVNETTESRETERKDAERRLAERMAEKAEGRGTIVTKDDIITETVDRKVVREEANVGGTGMSMDDMRQLAGLNKK
jgi:hypothetical protein